MVEPKLVRVLKGDVSDEAFEGWVRFASAQGIPLACLFEAVGLALWENEVWSHPLTAMSPNIQEAVERARQIAAERRSRR